jgi:hypothetical protein
LLLGEPFCKLYQASQTGREISNTSGFAIIQQIVR